MCVYMYIYGVYICIIIIIKNKLLRIQKSALYV